MSLGGGGGGGEGMTLAPICIQLMAVILFP